MKKIILLSLLFGASFVSANQDRGNLDRGIKKIEACYGSQDEPEICTAKFLNRKLNRVLNKLNRLSGETNLSQPQLEETNCVLDNNNNFMVNGVIIEKRAGEEFFDYIKRAYFNGKCSNKLPCQFKENKIEATRYCRVYYNPEIFIDGIKFAMGRTYYTCDFDYAGSDSYGDGDIDSRREIYKSLLSRNICEDLN